MLQANLEEKIEAFMAKVPLISDPQVQQLFLMELLTCFLIEIDKN